MRSFVLPYKAAPSSLVHSKSVSMERLHPKIRMNSYTPYEPHMI